MSITRDIYIIRISCILYSICAVSLILILSIFTNYYSDLYVKSLATSLVGPIPVSIIYYSIPRDNWCIYTISYYTLGKEYNNLYEDSCRFLNVRETMGFYQSNNPNNIFLDKNQLECTQIPNCEYYINMSETIRISNIGLSIFNLLIITLIVINIYRLENLRQQPIQYVDNSIVNPLHIVVNQ